VYISGGDESSFTFLYALSVVVAGVFQGRRGATGTAAVAWILYAGMVVLLMHGWLPGHPARARPMSEQIRERLYYSLAVHLIGFYLVALTTAHLTERVRLTRRELEQNRGELAALQALNSNILNSIHSGILATDLEGRVRFANPPGLEMLGRAGAELRHAPVAAVLGEGEDFLDRVRVQLEERRRFRCEKEFQNALGQRLHLGISAAFLLDAERRSQGLIFVFQDLTEVRALEDELKLKDRMAVLGEMAAGLAHELRNPLASMTGSVQMLRQDLRLEAEHAELMEIILRESQRLDRTIHDFLIFARPGRFHPQRADLAELARETLTLLRNSREFKLVHSVRTEVEPQADMGWADPNQLKQVFWNLATNALKAMPEGGCLTVKIARAGADRRRVSFCDQGRGMTPQQVERYFRPFQGSFHGGTGLGLSIVYRIVEEHGGSVRVRSARGEGTEIEIDLPAEPAIQAREVAPAVI
jgi:two-component system sensor histidine kinase PilS (NtrC family)